MSKRTYGRMLCNVFLFSVGAAMAAESVPAAQKDRKEMKLALFGSSSTGMLKRYMMRVLNENADLTVTFPTLTGRAPWVRVDWFAEDLEAGNTNKYNGYMADLQKLMNKKKFDYMVVQLSGGIFWKPSGEKHVVRIMDDLCKAIIKSGNKPLIFEHWTSRNPAKMTDYCVQIARKHGARVAFCGAASAEVIAEKGKKYIGGGEGHTNTKGLYLWTCCMYAALTGMSPVGLPLPSAKGEVGIPKPEAGEETGRAKAGEEEGGGAEEVVEVTKEDADYLQKKAWDVHRKYTKLLDAPVTL